MTQLTITKEQKQLVEKRNTLRSQRVNILRRRQKLQRQREVLLKRRERVELSLYGRARGDKLNLIQARVDKLQLEIRWLQESSARCQLVAAEIISAETSLQGQTELADVTVTPEMILSTQEKLQKLQEDVQCQREEGKRRREYMPERTR